MSICEKYAVLIPSFCPDDRIIRLASDLFSRGFSHVLVVDDGSGVEYLSIFARLEQLGCIVIRHAENRGKGVALKTGIAWLVEHVVNLRGIITADGDGQHAVDDICAVMDSLYSSRRFLVLGVRDFSVGDVPARSRLGNRFSSAYFKFSTRVSCPDTQTGLRGIPSCLFEHALLTPGLRYEYEMAFLTVVAKQNLPIRFVSIRTIYNTSNAGSHFRPIKDSLLIFQTPIKYLCSSLCCSLIDLGVFTGVSILFSGNLLFGVLFATVIARLMSGVLNFLLNHIWSFHSAIPVGIPAVKYAILFSLQMILSWLFVYSFSGFAVSLTLLKIPVDCLLFVFSYFVQSNWIFNSVPVQKRVMQK